MGKYILKTTTTMKEYNRNKFWIDANIIGEFAITADNVSEALKKYQEFIQDNHFIDISNNALKNKAPMYIDGKSGEALQIGYTITAKCDFLSDNGHRSTQYIDLWVEVLQYDYPEFT